MEPTRIYDLADAREFLKCPGSRRGRSRARSRREVHERVRAGPKACSVAAHETGRGE